MGPAHPQCATSSHIWGHLMASQVGALRPRQGLGGTPTLSPSVRRFFAVGIHTPPTRTADRRLQRGMASHMVTQQTTSRNSGGRLHQGLGRWSAALWASGNKTVVSSSRGPHALHTSAQCAVIIPQVVVDECRTVPRGCDPVGCTRASHRRRRPLPQVF